MKGVVLAGGLGTRLLPLTKVTNKHLLPVYNKPMIFYPVEALARAGIKDVLVVTGDLSAGDILRLLGNGRQFGLSSLRYAYQEGEGGIADALGLAARFAGDDSVIVVLGDNILQYSIRHAVEAFEQQGKGARILLKEVPDPERFGVPVFDQDRIVAIEEKPKHPKSHYAVIGVYMYDRTVFDVIPTLVPSARGELEITDVNNHFLRQGSLTYSIIDGWWTDAGTFDSLMRAALLVQETGGANLPLPEPPAPHPH